MASRMPVVRWTIKKKGEVVFDEDVDLNALESEMCEVLIFKAKRFLSDRIGAEDMMASQAREICSEVWSDVLDGTYVPGSMGIEGLDPCFKFVRDTIAQAAKVKKAVHKVFPDYATLQRKTSTATVDALIKQWEANQALEIVVDLKA